MENINSGNIKKHIQDSLEWAISSQLYNEYIPKKTNITNDKELKNLEVDFHVATEQGAKNLFEKYQLSYGESLKQLQLDWKDYTPDRLFETVRRFVRENIEGFKYENISTTYNQSLRIYQSITFCLGLANDIASINEDLKSIENAFIEKVKNNIGSELSVLIEKLTARLKEEEERGKKNYNHYLNTSYLLESGYTSASEYSSRNIKDDIEHIITLPKQLVKTLLERCYIVHGGQKYLGAYYYLPELSDLKVASSKLSEILRLLVKDFIESDWIMDGYISSLPSGKLDTILGIVTLLNKIDHLKTIYDNSTQGRFISLNDNSVEECSRLCWFGEPQQLADIFIYLFEECRTNNNAKVIKSDRPTMQSIIENNFCNENGRFIKFNSEGIAEWSDTRPNTKPFPSIKWYWQANSLVAILYDLCKTYKFNTRYLLEQNNEAIISFICRNFIDKEGEPFNELSIKRFVSDSTKLPPEVKGISSKRINLKRFFPQTS